MITSRLPRGLRGLALLGLAALAGVTALGAQAQAAPAAPGAGAELPGLAFETWCRDSGLCAYTEDDAGLGLDGLRRGTHQWIGVDAPLNRAQRQRAGGPVAYLPMMLGAIAVPVNIPRTDGHDVQLSGASLGLIFAGEITSWGDRRLQRQNQRHPLPRLAITLCVPRGASGSALDMSGFLAKASPAFRRTVGGASETPKWGGERVVRAGHFSEIADCVKRRSGAIGFMDLGHALRTGLSHDLIAVGKSESVTYGSGAQRETVMEMTYTHPTSKAIAAAGAGIHSTGRTGTFDLSHSAASGAYPISVGAWVAVRSDRPLGSAARRALQSFLTPTAQRRLDGLGFAPLPERVRADAARHLNALR